MRRLANASPFVLWLMMQRGWKNTWASWEKTACWYEWTSTCSSKGLNLVRMAVQLARARWGERACWSVHRWLASKVAVCVTWLCSCSLHYLFEPLMFLEREMRRQVSSDLFSSHLVKSMVNLSKPGLRSDVCCISFCVFLSFAHHQAAFQVVYCSLNLRQSSNWFHRRFHE